MAIHQVKDNEILYSVELIFDGIVRTYYCATHYDTVVLFDALYRGAQWDSITVTDLRFDSVVQSIGK